MFSIRAREAETSRETVDRDTVVNGIEDVSEQLLVELDAADGELQRLYEKMLVDNEDSLETEVDDTVAVLRRATSNISKANLAVISMNDELNARWHDVKKSRRIKHISAPANSMIDIVENKTDHFAQGKNFYKMALIFIIGSFLGVVVELIWCYVTRGYIESRSGLVYGPFNLLYGAGTVALTLALYGLRNHGRVLSFLGGMVVGSIVEYVCSFAMEKAFGSRSWDYSAMPFNINGRICLLYSIYWGFLGVLWIKNIYPRMAKLILKIPNSAGKIITWAMIIFLLFDGIVSFAAIVRWSQRVNNTAESGVVGEFLDEHFPDERMERVYANMVFNTDNE